MHELSLVMNILQMAETEAKRHEAGQVEAIRLEIGALSGVERSAFDFAWTQAVPGTVLQDARLEVTDTEGAGCCRLCNHHFPVDSLYTPCPHCGSYDVVIESGKEFKLQSLILITTKNN